MLSEPLETQLKANEKDGGVDEEMTDPRAVQGACMVIEPRPPRSPDRHWRIGGAHRSGVRTIRGIGHDAGRDGP